VRVATHLRRLTNVVVEVATGVSVRGPQETGLAKVGYLTSEFLPASGAPLACLGRCSTVLENAELVALRIGQNHPRNVALSNVNTRRSERDESPNLGGLIVRTKIDMETILALLRLVDSQEQDPWKPIWLWLNLKDG
jgi:hypothetical protein